MVPLGPNQPEIKNDSTRTTNTVYAEFKKCNSIAMYSLRHLDRVIFEKIGWDSNDIALR